MGNCNCLHVKTLQEKESLLKFGVKYACGQCGHVNVAYKDISCCSSCNQEFWMYYIKDRCIFIANKSSF